MRCIFEGFAIFMNLRFVGLKLFIFHVTFTSLIFFALDFLPSSPFRFHKSHRPLTFSRVLQGITVRVMQALLRISKKEIKFTRYILIFYERHRVNPCTSVK